MTHRRKRQAYQVMALVPSVLFATSLLNLSGRLSTALNSATQPVTPTVSPTATSTPTQQLWTVPAPDVQGTLYARATQIGDHAKTRAKQLTARNT